VFDTLVKRIEQHAKQQPDIIAVIFKKEQVTYAELWQKIVCVGSTLHGMGIQRGDRVVFTATSKPESVAVYLGIQYCGAISIYADKSGTAESIAAICSDVEAKLLLTDKPMKEYAQALCIRSLKEIYQAEDAQQTLEYVMPGADDIAEMLFTTGTTGKPKGVMLSYKAIQNIVLNNIQGVGIQATDRILVPLPLHHSLALRELRSGLYLGAVVVLQNGFTFAKELETNIVTYGCTALVSVPASMETIRMQMQDKFAEILGKLRYIEVGAGSLSIAQRKKLTEMLPNTIIHNTWGSSETGGALFLNVSEETQHPTHIESIGKPLSHIEVRTLDAEGQPFVSSKLFPGRLTLKGDMQMSGYWQREEQTKDALRDGWLVTNDMVYQDEDGYVYMLGRADDIINVGGEKVSPIEIENVACQQEHIRECACIGVSDPEGVLGQVPVLFVVPRSNQYSESELHKYLAGKMEKTKLPQHYVVIEELPRNRMLKIDRKKLRELWENRDSMALINPVVQALLSRRSIRRFTDQKIDPAILDMILRTAYHAPSCHNMQSWKFTVLESESSIERLKKVAVEAAKTNNKVYFYGFDNPTAVIMVSNDSRNPDSCQDASCAAENIMLAAHSYGIGSTWVNALVTLRNTEPVKSLLDEFGVPEGHVVWATVVLGYPVAESNMPAKKTSVISFVDR